MSMQVPTARSLVSWILTAALLYSAVDSLVFLVRFIALAGFQFFLIFIIPFTVLFFIFGYASYRQKKWGYLGGAISSLIFLILNGFDLARLLSTPADPDFASVFTIVMSSFAGVTYGFYGFYKSRKATLPPIQIQRSSVLALLVIGIAIGGLLIGTLSGITISRLLTTAGSGRDVTIVSGSANPNNGRFYDPATLSVTTGKTVVWFNGDTAAHTVTSSATPKAFDSGNMDPGAVYQHTFSQSGTFEYVCSYHAYMTAKIIVAP